MSLYTCVICKQPGVGLNHVTFHREAGEIRNLRAGTIVITVCGCWLRILGNRGTRTRVHKFKACRQLHFDTESIYEADGNFSGFTIESIADLLL